MAFSRCWISRGILRIMSVFNIFCKKFHRRCFTRLYVHTSWIALLPRKNLSLVITFYFLSLEWFLLHIIWYLFVLICMWFRYHRQSKRPNGLFANTLSNTPFIQPFLSQNSTCKWVYFGSNLSKACDFAKNDFFVGDVKKL